MFDRPPRYRSYLLTLWEERGRDTRTSGEWRFRLEDSYISKRVGFASLDRLHEHLRQQIGTAYSEEAGKGRERR
jgi:hypothetical protein